MNRFGKSSRWLIPPQSERSWKSSSNEWFMFRGFMTLQRPGRTSMLIAADSKYWLYINGILLVREGGLKRGPVPNGTYFDEIDLTKFVKRGRNCIAVLLWYFGRNGFSHRDSGQPGLLMEAHGLYLKKWKVRRHPAFFDAGYMGDAYRLSENSIGFDARCDIPGWTQADFEDKGWPYAEIAEPAGEGPWGALEPRPFAQWYWSELKEYASVIAKPSGVGDGSTHYHCNLPYNCQFIPALSVKASAGARIDISPAHRTNRLCPTYITSEGEQSYESIGWISGQELVYKIPAHDVCKPVFRYRETSYPADSAGSFDCNDPLLSSLWTKGQRTLLLTMRDTFMDCPCRERAQWPGDMVVQIGQVPYCLSREADSLVRKGLRETLRWQRSDGVIYGPVPEGNWRMELPAQMLAVVSRYGIWNYFMNTGDRETLEELYPYAKRYLDIWTFQKNGLIKYRPERKGTLPRIVDGISVGTWDWLDWGERIDAEPLLNAWFVLAANGVRQMADELGYNADSEQILLKEQLVINAIRKEYWNGKVGAFVSNGFAHVPDDRVQALMILSGAAMPEHYADIIKIFKKVEQASPYMERYVLEALFEMGEERFAIKRMLKRFRGMAENSSSTLWELWPEWPEYHGTINHSWSGGPLTILTGQVAGIRPFSPGWQKISICPKPGGLKLLSTSVVLTQGELRFKMQKDKLSWKIEIVVPNESLVVFDTSGFCGMNGQEFGPGTHHLELPAWAG